MSESKSEVVSINFRAFFQIIWKEKLVILLILTAATGLGFWKNYSSPDEFTSYGRILPEFAGRSNRLGGLAGLASIAGLEMSGADGVEAIRPDLYPDVLWSAPFFLELFKQTVTTKNNKKILFKEFYINSVLEGDTSIVKIAETVVKAPGYLVLNPQDMHMINALKYRIAANIDKKSMVIDITVTMPDPVVAAEVASFSMKYLTNYVTGYRIDKAKRDLTFLEERLDAAKGKFYSTQNKKAQYSDQFQISTMRSQSADVQRERLESDYRMSSTFYSELLRKYEEAKIKVQQETPVFKVLEPPVVPIMRSSPVTLIILITHLFFGGLIALVVAISKSGNYKKILTS